MERRARDICGQDASAASGRKPATPLRAPGEDLLPGVKNSRWRALRCPYNNSVRQ